MNVIRLLPLLVSFVLIVAQETKEKTYKQGRAFPMRSLDYVKKKFKELNSHLKWDNMNYLERMAADYSSCKYEEGLIEGYASIPNNESYIAFVEYEQLEGNTASFVMKHLVPIVDKWVTFKRYNEQIGNAKTFACSVNPGCGYNEKRMGVSCVFSPSSEIYEEPEEVKKPPQDLPAPSEAEGLPDEGYQVIGQFSNDRAVRSEFFENLSILETSCEMLLKDEWDFKTSQTVIEGTGLNAEGFYGRAQIKGDETVLDTAKRLLHDLHRAKSIFSKEMRIGCSIIKDCVREVDGEQATWLVLSCLYGPNDKLCI